MSKQKYSFFNEMVYDQIPYGLGKYSVYDICNTIEEAKTVKAAYFTPNGMTKIINQRLWRAVLEFEIFPTTLEIKKFADDYKQSFGDYPFAIYCMGLENIGYGVLMLGTWCDE